ncbi:MAG: PQQ-binding-like beta-propeller repeat protein [Gemmataceae bacterium]
MNHPHTTWVLSLSLLCLVSSSALGQTIEGWRTDGSGQYPNANPPTKWSKTENVVWATELPASNSLPVLVEDRIFVCAEPTTVFCLDANKGTILWRKDQGYQQVVSPNEWAKVQVEIAKVENLQQLANKARREARSLTRKFQDKLPENIQAQIAELEKQQAKIKATIEKMPLAAKWAMPRTHRGLNGYSTPTPVTDGKHLWTLFGNGVAACYTLEGKRVWIKVIDRPQANFGLSSSPLRIGNTLVVTINKMLGLDPKTGKLLWESNSKQTWGSPTSITVNGTRQILSPRGEIVDPNNGKIVAKGRRLNTRHSTPVVGENSILFMDQISNAVSIPREDETNLPLVWSQRLPQGRYFSSPIVYDGLVYTINEAQILSVLDTKSGKIVNQKQMGENRRTRFFSSLARAGKYIYLTNSQGTTHVIRGGKKYVEVARNELDEPVRSSPVFRGNTMYLRTTKHLYCIREKNVK